MMISWLTNLLGCLACPLIQANSLSPLTTEALISTSPVSTQTQAPLELSFAPNNFLTLSQVQSSSPLIAQGQEISINGRKLAVAWSQWHEGTSVRTGISDTGAMQVLGVELLSTSNPAVQPVSWFSSGLSQPSLLQARFVAPYRYLDITDLIPSEWQLQALGNTLEIQSTPAQILDIRVGKQDWGQRVVLDLDRPTLWHIAQTQEAGVLTLEGIVAQTLLRQLQPPGEESIHKALLPFNLEALETTAKLQLPIPKGKRLHVFSLSKPNRIVIDIRSLPLAERDIVWAPGIRWVQQSVALATKQFSATWLEIDPRSNASLTPITSLPDTQTGIAPLVSTARAAQASAAINGGFFNRNNQLPLGAIRQDGRWLSGPILNRGAIAWGNGAVKIGRLSLQEALITSNEHLPILFLNSGYVEAGLSRYTPEWGASYSPLTDNETIITVQDNRITEIVLDVSDGYFPIPADGYLLTLRGRDLPTALKVNAPVTLKTVVPTDFIDYPQIVAAGPLLLQNRQVVLDAEGEKFSRAFQHQAASRSVIATTETGTLILAAIHAGSMGKGPTLEELAQIMQRLGAVDALNLDGGSSTALYLGGQLIDRSPNSAARVHNGIGIFVR